MAEGKPLERGNEATENVRIRRARVDCVNLYEVKEDELDILEKGSPATIQLNFAIFLLSIAASSVVALCTTKDYKYPMAETLFAIIAVIGLFGGIYLLIMWLRTRQSISAIVKTIRQRMPDDSEESTNQPPPAPLFTPIDDRQPSKL